MDKKYVVFVIYRKVLESSSIKHCPVVLEKFVATRGVTTYVEYFITDINKCLPNWSYLTATKTYKYTSPPETKGNSYVKFFT